MKWMTVRKVEVSAAGNILIKENVKPHQEQSKQQVGNVDCNGG